MTPSYAHGVSEEPLIGMTIGQALDHAARQWGDRDALCCLAQNIRLDWQQLHARVTAFAAGLLASGLSPGDRIGIWSPNRAEWVISQFATAKAGLVLVTINPAYRLDELRHVLQTVGCTALILSPPFKGSNYPEMVGALAAGPVEPKPGQPLIADLPMLHLLVQIGDATLPSAVSFAKIEELGRAADPRILGDVERRVQFDDPVNIQFTSGTTGVPKGVTLSHSNILSNGYFTGRTMRLGLGDKLCLPVPLYHCFGMVTGTLLCLTRGVTIVLPSLVFEPVATLEAIAGEGCTALYGVPTMYIAMLGHPSFGSFDLSSLRTGIMAGSICPIELMRQVMSDMHMREITICYGMTESPVSFQTAIDDPIERRVGTVGRAQPHIEAKLIDTDGRIVPRDTTGEICTRGYSAMLGYWDDPDNTAATKDRAGWVHTGDLGVMDEEGYLRIVGRLKDMVIRGGENLYPREIEEFLFGHPAVSDVQVFGVSDTRFGEELCAWIILKAGHELDEAGVREYCRDRISHQKIPRYMRFVDHFPLTVTGKVQKATLRLQMESLLGL